MKRVSARARDRCKRVRPSMVSLRICSIFPSTGFHNSTLPWVRRVTSPSKPPPLGAATKYQSAPSVWRCDHIRSSAFKSGAIWSSSNASSRDIPLRTLPFPIVRTPFPRWFPHSLPAAASKRRWDSFTSFSVAIPSGISATKVAPAMTSSTIFSSVSGKNLCDSGNHSRR